MRLQQVSKYVLDHPDEVTFDTLTVIAERAGVYPSTMVRFANAFGYSGFTEMQKLFKAQVLEQHPSYRERIRLLEQVDDEEGGTPPTPMRLLTEFTHANLESLERFHNQVPVQALDDAVQLLPNARSIFVVGVRRSYAAAVYAMYALSHVDRPTHLVDGAGGMLRENESELASSLCPGSSQGFTADSYPALNQAMSLSSTGNTPRRRSGGRVFSIVLSFSVRLALR